MDNFSYYVVRIEDYPMDIIYGETALTHNDHTYLIESFKEFNETSVHNYDDGILFLAVY